MTGHLKWFDAVRLTAAIADEGMFGFPKTGRPDPSEFSYKAAPFR